MDNRSENLGKVDHAMAAIDALRQQGTHVHSITNTVVQNFTANVLLACGATVSMTANPEEVESFVPRAAALHINLGTLDEERRNAIGRAVDVAKAGSVRIVVDPVMVHASPTRLKFAKWLVSRDPDIIKMNAAEAGVIGDIGRCRVVTGALDRIAFNGSEITIANGHDLMEKVIGSGCALGALLAALLPRSKDPATAALAGVLWFSVAGELAAQKSKGPGTFVPRFLDCLFEITTNEILDRMKLK